MNDRLYIYVEGKDDEKFFCRVLKSVLRKKYSRVEIISYNNGWDEDDLRHHVTACNDRDVPYLFISDFDKGPCIGKRKEKILSTYNFLNKNNIFFVRKMIESWYIAGLTDKKFERLEIGIVKKTDDITKARFKALTPKKLGSAAFKNYILSNYSLSTARRRNSSLDYFLTKHCDS